MNPDKQHKLELLAPAANAKIAMEAIKHGADAVYIGPPSHGARKNASNSLDDIAEVVDFAHQFRAKVYATVNTIIYEEELNKVATLCRDLYRIGVDALIVQDMSLLRMDLPPIALHASTQCDIRTPEKARFLQEVGFSQLVLARELTLREIREIASAVNVPLECFVHGALCVSYSGKCHASCSATGRSANRGECAQLCRLPYDLVDSAGNVFASNAHLLSLKDFNASEQIPQLIEAGVSSFKIEGRLKEADYVKNITSYYDVILNRFINERPESFVRSSYGSISRTFSPNPSKSFNRGFTEYFLKERRPDSIASISTPKSMGEVIKDVKKLHNGDGISFIDRNGEWQGVNINKIVNGKIVAARKIDIPKNAELHRTFDVEWQKAMNRPTAERRLNVDISLDPAGVTASDARGITVRIPLDVTKDVARNPMDYKDEFTKLGNTIYSCRRFSSSLDPFVFIPRSEIASLRREIVAMLDFANKSSYSFSYRDKENSEARYPLRKLDFRENVANSLAQEFYESHVAIVIERALECGVKEDAKKRRVVMTTRHCILRELGMCRRLVKDKFTAPLFLKGPQKDYLLHFNCADCEMEVIEDSH